MTIHNRMMQMAVFTLMAASGVFVAPFTSEASTTTSTCAFTRDLQLGMTGDDIKCLQKYLNTHGFPIAASGVGSAGHETGEYKALTEVAVIKWQKAKKLLPAIGYFGAQSRLLFKTGKVSVSSGTTEPYLGAPLIKAPATAEVADPATALRAQVESLKAVLEGRTTALPTITATSTTVAATVVTSVETTSLGATDASVRTLFSSVLSMVAKAESALRKNSSASGSSDARDTIATAKDEILIALRSYVANDYITAATTLEKAKRDASIAYTTAGAVTQKQQASKSLASVRANYTAANVKITKADNDGKTVTSAIRFLKKAAKAIDDVQTAIDDEKYADALDSASVADGYVSDAADAIGK